MRAIRNLLRMRRPRRGEDGYVLATAVTISFVVILTVTAVVTVQLGNIGATRRAIGQQQSRAAAESALDQTYLDFLGKLNTNSGLTPDAVVTDQSDASGNWKWFRAAEPDSLCVQNATEVCFHIEVKRLAANDYLMEVTSRSRCVGPGLVPGGEGRVTSDTKCIVTKYQQRIRKKQYFDYLTFTDRETVPQGWVDANLGAYPLPPGQSLVPVAYSNGDVLRGPVRSNGQIFVCSDPQGNIPQFLRGATSTVGSFGDPGLGCPSSAANGRLILGNRIDLPQSTALVKLEEIARSMDLSRPVTATDTRLEFNGTRYSIDGGPSAAIPKNAVFYFAGDVRVTGVLAGNATVVAGRDIGIQDNLRYQCMDEPQMRALYTQPNVPPCSDSLGLISGRDIRVLCPGTTDFSWQETAPSFDGSTGEVTETGRCAPPGQDRYLVGALLALGVVATQRWASATSDPSSPAGVPNLHFFGTTTSPSRPVWGLTSTQDGRAVRGLAKKFTFDEKLKDRQPPSFLEPNNAPWERIDLIEVAPCAAGINGPPRGAGCT